MEGGLLDQEQWGLKHKDAKLVHTDLPAAAEEILEVIRYTYKTGCAMAKCTCKKHGLDC